MAQIADFNDDSKGHMLRGKIEVKVKIANKSALIKGLIEDAGIEEEIPLPNIRKAIIDKIITFCEYIDSNAIPEIEKPLRSSAMIDLVSPWYAEFIDLP